MKPAAYLLLLLSCPPSLARAQAKPAPAPKATPSAPPKSAQQAHRTVEAHKASIGQKFIKRSKPSTQPDMRPVQQSPLK